jgi:hypothetical protein
MLGSNIGREIVPTLIQILHGFPEPLGANSRIVPRLGYDSLLSNRFQLTVHRSPYNLTL